ncbi:MAG: hypothetical protein GW795_14560 [Cyanobacteria bacterium]|nr:hypothetical protein [Cyanobacteria bacterium CG_2015-16_32_12]NCO79561.1 hypothetical protein [Cyanobacteria bacterium CG_2015-22_32_23]NCQ03530.1 hypothetical protein [Cyanobacteria bacterium CG_2015-09_32_10]NCQ43052.1 hypothetical protein [Cyanobacteria bacterium CG_2015-04_32_10]NCS84354.1 hypothetical protein [Cyanobacteria bacterium CG_2015-02_32_10]
MNNDSNHTSNDEGDKPKVTIPDPDLDNITVLTNNLPNKPILPWNRYDSDWDENVNQNTDTKNNQNSEEE